MNSLRKLCWSLSFSVLVCAAPALSQRPYFPNPLLQFQGVTGPGGSGGASSQNGLLVDVNGDGSDDAVSQGNLFLTSTASFFLVSLADGSADLFANPGMAWPTVHPLSELATADFDGDGDSDILALSSNLATLTLWVHLNDGQGDFSSVVQTTLPPGFSTPFIGNLDSGGVPDVMLWDGGTQYVVLLGNGNGAFGAAIPGLQFSASGLTLLDDDQDGDDDVHYIGNAGVLVQRNNGNGTFAPAQVLVPPPFIAGQRILYGDVDADGDTDGLLIAPSGPGSSTQVQVLRRGPAGALIVEPPQTMSDRSFNRAITPEDMDGDGAVEFIASQAGLGGDSLLYLVNDGTGNFSVRAEVDFEALLNYFGPEVGDFNGDGIPDIVNWIGGGLIPHRGVGGSDILVPEILPAQDVDLSAQLRIADLNNDGQSDAIFPSSMGGARVINSILSIGFAPSRITTAISAGIHDFDLGDFNGNGILDLVSVAGANFGSVEVRLGDGLGGFGSALSLPSNGPARQTFARDMDGDGRLDIVVRDSEIRLYLGLGNGQFSPGIATVICDPVCSPGLNTGTSQIAIGDINGDGILDVASTALGLPATPGFPPPVSSIVSLLGNGGGSFAAPLFTGTYYSIGPFTLVDANVDGYADLIAPANSILIAAGRPTGTFGLATGYPIPAGSSNLIMNAPLTTGDINGDGVPDAMNASGALWIGTPLWGIFGRQQRYAQSIGTSCAIDDVDNDLQPDFLTLLPGDGGLHLMRHRTPCSGIGASFGMGCPGSNGIRPTLSARGCAQPGGQISLDFKGALGGTTAWLIVGNTPATTAFASGCFAHVELNTAALAPITLQGQARPGGGTLTLSTALAPSIPPGLSFALQFIVSDPGSPIGLSGSNGLYLSIR